MRLKWDEKARRLAIEHDMVDEIESSLGSKSCVAMGVEHGIELIRWTLSGDTIIVQET